MNNFSFTKTDSKIAKGFAVILMLAHHLFAYNRIPDTYVTLLPSTPVDLLALIGRFGNICVSVFVFLSGYGIYFISRSTDLHSFRVQKLIRFITNYLLVFIVCIPIGFIFFNRTFYWKEFLMNLSMLSYSYNSEWWFLRVYIELLLLSPYIISFIKTNWKTGTVISILLSGIGFVLHESNLYQNIWIQEVSTLLLWQIIFVLGALCIRFNMMEKCYQFLEQHHLNRIMIYSILLIFCIVFRELTPFPAKVKDPLIVGPFILSGVLLVRSLHLQSFFSFVGARSMNIWLIHTFFCYYYTPDLVLKPRNSFLILVWLLLLSLAGSCMIEYLYALLSKGMKLWRKQNHIPKNTY